ncbi:MAG: AraC family transcriptional regulator [Deinococcota bacterium]
MTKTGHTHFWFNRELNGMEALRSNELDPAYPKHMHSTFTIGIVDTGVVINYSRGETNYIPTNSIYTFNPAEVHSGYAHQDVLISHRTFYPSESALLDIAKDIGLRGTPYFKTTSFTAPQTVRRLRALHHLLEHSNDLLERQSALVEGFGYLLVQHTSLRVGQQLQGREPKAIKTTRDYLNEHFMENVSLDTLAELVGLSRAYLIRSFKREMGLPPYSYLIQKRIEVAKRLLRAGVPPAQVALDVGFSDQSHLHLHFKRIMNLSPGRYARSHYLPRKIQMTRSD